MKRWAFKVASVLSLLLCLATIVAEVRSQRVFDIVRRGVGSEWELGCGSYRGQLNLCVVRFSGIPSTPAVAFESREYMDYESGPYTLERHIVDTYSLGYGRAWGRNDSPNTIYPSGGPGISYMVTCWFVSPRDWQLALFFAVLPTWWVVRCIRALGNVDPKSCPACDYNLTGNMSGMCPECGRVIA